MIPTDPSLPGPAARLRDSVSRWFDSAKAPTTGAADGVAGGVDWLRVLPFIALHLACAGVLLVGVSWFAVATAVLLYAVRMFAITAFYHRYFSHKAFRTSRLLQFLGALLGASAAQRGPLWWAAHHREHHRHADTGRDPHSPRQGFLHSHVGWFLTSGAFRTRQENLPDLRDFPELRWIDRFDTLVPVLLAMALFALGAWLQRAHPGFGTSAAQLVVWGFFVSTVALFHATVSINSLAHRWGSRRYATRDDSRNNWWLALLTFGEGWHNNHHHYPGSARQGFRWWEIDFTYYLLRLMSCFGLVWDLKPLPAAMRAARWERP